MASYYMVRGDGPLARPECPERPKPPPSGPLLFGPPGRIIAGWTKTGQKAGKCGPEDQTRGQESSWPLVAQVTTRQALESRAVNGFL